MRTRHQAVRNPLAECNLNSMPVEKNILKSEIQQESNKENQDQYCRSERKAHKECLQKNRKIIQSGDPVDIYFEQILIFCESYQKMETGLPRYKEKDNILGLNKKVLQNEHFIDQEDRKKLIGWIMSIHRHLKLRPETLYMTIYLIDQFTQKKHTIRKHYQLIGLTSLFIAGKYEQIATPKLKNIAKCIDSFESHDILKMQSQIFQILQFNISKPTISWFLNAYIQQIQHIGNKIPSQYSAYCHYLMDLCLFEKDIVEQYDSKCVAKTIIYVASMVGQFLDVDSKYLILEAEPEEKKQLKKCIIEVRKVYRNKCSEQNREVILRYPNFHILYR